jgi:hypothetical protein
MWTLWIKNQNSSSFLMTQISAMYIHVMNCYDPQVVQQKTMQMDIQ